MKKLAIVLFWWFVIASGKGGDLLEIGPFLKLTLDIHPCLACEPVTSCEEVAATVKKPAIVVVPCYFKTE